MINQTLFKQHRTATAFSMRSFHSAIIPLNEENIHFQLNQWRFKSINTGSLTAFNRNICINQRHMMMKEFIACVWNPECFVAYSQWIYSFEIASEKKSWWNKSAVSRTQNAEYEHFAQFNNNSLIQSSDPWFFSRGYHQSSLILSIIIFVAN